MLDTEIEDFAQATRNYQSILLKYCTLATRSTLSEADADDLDRILAQAETDELLNFLLIEFDHLIAEELNLFDQQHLSGYEDQQAYLREHLVQLTPEDLAYYRELQKLLQKVGCYRGPVDGVFGEDSRKAVEEFQESADLQADGELTPETVLKLAPTAEAVLKLTRAKPPNDS